MELFGAKVLVVNTAKIKITANLLQRFLHIFRPKNSSDCKEVLLNEIGGSRPFAAIAKKLLGVWRCPVSFAITRCHVIFEIPCFPKI